MINLNKILGFEWDKGNIDKSFIKHGITPKQSEELFLDEDLFLQEDIKHTQREERFIAIGKTVKNDILFSIFTIRNNKIRIISVRKTNKRELALYK